MMRKLKDDVLLCLIYLAAFGAEFLLLGILVYVFVKGFPYVDLQFLTTVTSVLQGTVGIAGNMVNTIYIVVLTLDHICHTDMSRDTFHPLRTLWYDVFWHHAGAWIFHFDRSAYAFFDGAAIDYEKYAGGASCGAGKLQERRA